MYAQQIAAPVLNISDGLNAMSPLQFAEDALAHRCLLHLKKAFPSYPWLVGVDLKKRVGIIKIRYEGLPGMWGVYVHAKTLKSENGFKRMERLVGEMLERFKLSRERYFDHHAPLARPQR